MEQSIKETAVKATANTYVLSKTDGMKTDVVAFLSEELYQSSDPGLWEQIKNMASYPGVIGAYLMPDCHLGFGTPIGSVVITEDTLIQACNGYDISCGILHLKVPGLTATDVQSKEIRRKWITEIEKRIPTGAGNNRPNLMVNYSEAKGEEILRYGAKALDIKADLCERQYIPVPESLDLKKIPKANEKVLQQLGSVGGGNHYIELQVDAKTREVWVMIHCGSRGYGYQTANHFFYEGAKLRDLPSNKRESSWLYKDELLGKEYWDYMATAANYAIANRHIITQAVQQVMQELFKKEGEIFYEISHNLVQEETLVLPDGSHKKGFVHRKGATRAFPAGHPDLIGTIWEKTGHPILSPGSMMDGAAILFPQQGAYKSGCSVNHGSGRILGRKDAKRKLGAQQQEINKEMANIKRSFGGTMVEGIITNGRDVPIDESSRVYKDLDKVLAVLEAENVAKITHRLYPIANIKSSD